MKPITKRYLCRDFIYDRLYCPNQGYFMTPSLQLGYLKQPLDFSQMFGYKDYQSQLYSNYPSNAWLTPSEIFKPFYGLAIANYINQVIDSNTIKGPLNIIEAGAGNGSVADNILTYFMKFENQKYQQLNYKVVEISPVLCAKAKKLLSDSHPLLFEKQQIQIVNDDILSFRQSNGYNFVILLEVLDNMPHDRLFRQDRWSQYSKQAYIDQSEDGSLQELQLDIDDKLTIELLNLYQKYQELDHDEPQISVYERLLNFVNPINTNSLFLPTYCYKFMKRLNHNIANHHLIISDFDSLRNKSTSKLGINAPIISQKQQKSEQHKDYQDYLVQQGEADIFFPTDFEFLKMMYKQTTGRKSENMKSYQFMSEHSKAKWTQTESGYNPIKEDFGNTRFFLSL